MRYRFLRFPEGKPKAVTFSYDDGIRQDIRFSELLTSYNLKATFNLNSQDLRGARGLQTEEVKRYILDKGHEVAIHGYNHRAEGRLRPIDAIRDILDCRIELENNFGMIIRGMAYPDTGICHFSTGIDYERIKSYLTDLDIAYSRTLGGDNQRFELPNDWHAWMPSAHHNNPQIMEYIDKFLALDLSPKAYCAGRAPRLFYIWGHSYEFDKNDGWNLIESICQKLANQDDIWYATNIEIHDYVEAYNSLIYSADETMVYNPGIVTIWFDVDGQLYEIKPGETLKL